MLRQLHLYDLGNFSWTVIRYFLRQPRPPLAIGRLPIGIAATSFGSLSIPLPRRTRRGRSRPLTAIRRAVPLTAVAATTQEKQLPADGASAQDKTKRIQGSASWLRPKLDPTAKLCDEHLVDAPGSVSRHESSEIRPPGFHSFRA
jgi:hypothetical protein